FFFFKQKTAYEISRDWSSDVCSSDLHIALARHGHALLRRVPLHFRRRRQDAQHFSGQLERRMVGKGNGQQFAVLRDPKFLRRDHSGMSFPPPNEARLARFAARRSACEPGAEASAGWPYLERIAPAYHIAIYNAVVQRS